MEPTTSIPRRPPARAAVWGPWLAAPLFALLPLGGCGLADGFRPALSRPSAAAASRPPAAADEPRMTIVQVVPVAGPTMAWGPAAD